MIRCMTLEEYLKKDTIEQSVTADKNMIERYADQIAQIIEHCEFVQDGDDSDYTKKMAKIHAYDDIVALVKVRR